MAGMTRLIDPWESAWNAQRYAEFARTYPMYRQTSRDIVDLAYPAADATIVDLACGTGTTTEAVLSVLGENGVVIAVDGSKAMLDTAQLSIRDERVRWLHLPAERLDDGTEAGADAVVCNAAIWQTDVRATAAAVRRVLRPGGLFVFNLPEAMFADHAGADPDPLLDAMITVAARDYDWVPPALAGEGADGQECSETGLCHVLHETGFRVDRIQGFSYQVTLREHGAWLSVPVFTARLFADLPYLQRMAALRQAYRRLAADHPDPVTIQWVAFAANATELA